MAVSAPAVIVRENAVGKGACRRNVSLITANSNVQEFHKQSLLFTWRGHGPASHDQMCCPARIEMP